MMNTIVHPNKTTFDMKYNIGVRVQHRLGPVKEMEWGIAKPVELCSQNATIASHKRVAK